MSSTLLPKLGRTIALSGLLFVLHFVPSAAFSQDMQTTKLRGGPSAYAADELPDSPGAITPAPLVADLVLFVPPAQSSTGVPAQIAPRYKRIVKADQTALPLTAGDKMVLSMRQRVTPVAIASTLVSVGISHLYDSRPHYGTDKAGFGERLGATELRQTSQSFLSYGLIASVLHDDPRYYVLGPTHSPKHRAIYAAERIFITRKDNGHHAINFPQLIGIASAQTIANSYYPTRDQSVRRTITGTISSYGTTALTNEVNEFLGDVITHLRHKARP